MSSVDILINLCDKENRSITMQSNGRYSSVVVGFKNSLDSSIKEFAITSSKTSLEELADILVKDIRK